MDETATEPVCYRHSDRVTYLRCSECEKPICHDCSYDSAVGQKCAECAKHVGRGAVVSSRQIQNQRTPVVMTILVATVVAYLYQRSNSVFEADFLLSTFLVQEGEWWRTVTSAFLHSRGSFMHIGFNMYALYIFGPTIERQVGGTAFAGLYLASAIGGSLAFVMLANGAAVGASGAIFGLFGAVLMGTWPRRHTPAGAAQFRQLVILLAINMALPLFIPFIAWEAHLGGLVVGMAIVAIWQRIPTTSRSALQRSAVAYGIAAVGLLSAILL